VNIMATNIEQSTTTASPGTRDNLADRAMLRVSIPGQGERVLEGVTGQSVMEVIRNAGISELPALCGGCCSCATCHVHVSPGWFARLPEMGEAEEALLDEAAGRTEHSRLSCQIPFSAALDGLAVTIAEFE